MRSIAFLTAGLSLAALAACRAPLPIAADLIVMNARIWTGETRQPSAAALAIIGERIVAIGESKEIERWHGRDTQVFDAEGRRAIPGFNDAHVHFVDGGAELENVDLKDAETPAEFAR